MEPRPQAAAALHIEFEPPQELIGAPSPMSGRGTARDRAPPVICSRVAPAHASTDQPVRRHPSNPAVQRRKDGQALALRRRPRPVQSDRSAISRRGRKRRARAPPFRRLTGDGDGAHTSRPMTAFRGKDGMPLDGTSRPGRPSSPCEARSARPGVGRPGRLLRRASACSRASIPVK